MKQRWKCVGVLLLLCAACSLRSPLGVDQQSLREHRVQVLLKQAIVGLRRGETSDLLEAGAALNIADELLPNDPRIVDGLGCVAWRQGDFLSAEYYFQRALALDPQYDRPLEHLALLAEQRREIDKARFLLQQALDRNPLNFRARNNLAALFLKYPDRLSGRGRGFLELRKSLATNVKNNPAARFNLDWQERSGELAATSSHDQKPSISDNAPFRSATRP